MVGGKILKKILPAKLRHTCTVLRTHMGNRSGQASFEYLLLLVLVFMTSYIMLSGPFSNFTQHILGNVENGIGMLVKHAEWTGNRIELRSARHPANPQRLRPMH
ncbi:MAG: hypothetical protein HY537_12185 [Deltaproteobacteria bacterium]|nr:hypothetical protein [Deltaproteobacteria bacterium]